jgi:preprotein translocase subunit YajC
MTGIAYAQTGAATGAGGGLAGFLPLILIFVVFYFLLIRPQQKKAKQHTAFLGQLKKGDDVVTSGGIHGKITGLTDTIITLEIADSVRIKVNRPSVLASEADTKNQAEIGDKKSGG